MEENIRNEEMEQEGYTPRPMWQVWLARIGVVIMAISIALWLYHIAFPV